MSAVTNLADYRQSRQQPEQPEQRMQQQEGYVTIPNDVEDALLCSPLTHRQERVYRAILRKTLGYRKQSDCIATCQLAEMTGFDESDIRKALAFLVDSGLLYRGKRSKFGTEYRPVLDVSQWEFIANRANHPEQGDLPRLAPRTGRITPNKQGDLPPTTNNYNIQTTTPLTPHAENPATLPAAIEPTAEPKPVKSPRTGYQTFRKWSEAAKAAGEDLMPASDPIFDYASDAGIPHDFLRLAWVEFRDRYSQDDKRYKDWRNVFGKSVRECWFKLWYIDAGGQYLLTSKGQQAMQAMQARMRREAESC